MAGSCWAVQWLRRLMTLLVSGLLLGCSGLQSPLPPQPLAPTYEVQYRAEFVPSRGVAVAQIEVVQTGQVLRQLDFHAPARRYRPLAADGKLTITERGFRWEPPANGGVLHYEMQVARIRGQHQPARFDARMEPDWALLRLDHLFPPAASRTQPDAQSLPRLSLSGPPDWSFETRYGALHPAGIQITELERGFVRPTGWMLAGRLGIRREEIAGREVAVAAPLAQGFRRNDILAMLNWNLAELVRVFPDLPPQLLIVGAADPSWRGGLSGPGSMFLHADRPMINEDGTSTLLHELVHVASRQSGAGEHNWIAEGIAEYYGLEIMRRSGTITAHRYDLTLARMQQRAQQVDSLRARRVSHDQRAAAARLMYDIDQEIQAHSRGRRSLDDLMPLLDPQRGALTLEIFSAALTQVLGAPSMALAAYFPEIAQ